MAVSDTPQLQRKFLSCLPEQWRQKCDCSRHRKGTLTVVPLTKQQQNGVKPMSKLRIIIDSLQHSTVPRGKVLNYKHTVCSQVGFELAAPTLMVLLS